MISIQQARQQITQILAHHLDKNLSEMREARLESDILLTHVLQQARTYLYTHPELFLNKDQYEQLIDLVKQRQTGIPIAYLVGQKEFWSLPLAVNQAVLIPRPETELLVDIVLKERKDLPKAQILELGTGSGAIALAIASEKPRWTITAVDISEEALRIAKINAQNLGFNGIQFLQSDWYAALPPEQTFDIIVANPPYIAEADPHLSQGDLRFEPSIALVAEQNGLGCLQHIIQHGLAMLKPNGLLLVEHGYDQSQAVGSYFKKYGFRKITAWKDLQNYLRVGSGVK